MIFCGTMKEGIFMKKLRQKLGSFIGVINKFLKKVSGPFIRTVKLLYLIFTMNEKNWRENIDRIGGGLR